MYICMYVYMYVCMYVCTLCIYVTRCYHGHLSSLKVLSDYKMAQGLGKSEDVSKASDH